MCRTNDKIRSQTLFETAEMCNCCRLRYCLLKAFIFLLVEIITLAGNSIVSVNYNELKVLRAILCSKILI